MKNLKKNSMEFQLQVFHIQLCLMQTIISSREMLDMSNGSDSDDAWKIFNRDTEAGRLLSRLYGSKTVVAPSGRVSYPKQRRRRRVTDSSSSEGNEKEKLWKTTYTVHSMSKAAEEEKEQERKENIARALSLAVPKVGRGGEQRHSIHGNSSNDKIDQIPRRKTALTCRNTIEETLQKNKHYRPPHSNNMTEEKKRLNEIFGNGGHCLPEDLTSIPLNANRPSGGAKPSDGSKSNTTRPSTLFDQIFNEIKERRQHQYAMEKIGSGESTRAQVAYEIKERMERLRRLDPQRALAVVQKMMKS